MIRKLRMKFIAVSMLSMLLVLLIIMSIVNFLNYQKVVEDADSILLILKENDGEFPKEKELFRKKDHLKKSISPEAPYESRYFSVLLEEENGEVVSIDIGRVVSVDEEKATGYAQDVWSNSKTQGFLSNYRYIKQMEDGKIQIIFLDCRRSLTTFQSFLTISILVSILGFVSVLFLVIIFSKKIIKPVYESYEKQKQFITDAGHEINCFCFS